MSQQAIASVILFDGYCNLCSGSVQFILRHDHKKRFRFASLQGRYGRELLDKIQGSGNSVDSFILVEGDRVFLRSTGALKVARRLSGPWPLLYAFILIPRFIRDAVYKWVARNRYKWFGKKKECWIPDPEWAGRFLD